jgi:hypothetical protein
MYCVTPTECAVSPARQFAHGHLTIIDICSCGLVRYGERNQNYTNYGPWQKPNGEVND